MNINRDQLLEALQTVQPSVAKEGNRAIQLCKFWFDGERVSGYNGRVGIFAPIDLDIQGGVDDNLRAWLEKTTPGSTAEITAKRDHITATIGKSVCTRPLIDGQVITYEEACGLKNEQSKIVLSKSEVDDIANVLLSLDDKSAVPARMGAFVVPDEKNKDQLHIYSTDDNTISWLRMNTPKNFELDQYIVVPTAFIQQLAKLAKDNDDTNDTISLYISGGILIAENENTGVLVIGNLVDCPNMPDFVGELQVFDDSEGVAIPEELPAALERILLIQNAAVEFSVVEEILRIRSERETGLLNEEIMFTGHAPINSLYDPELVNRAVKGRDTILIDPRAMALKGPASFLHLIAPSRATT